MPAKDSGRKVRVTVTLPVAEADRLRRIAKRNHRTTVSAEVRHALDGWYRERRRWGV